MTSLPENVDGRTLKKVISLFRSELELSSIEPEDDFFDLGGDSLMAESLITAINKAFKKSYDVSNILDFPTPISFARSLSVGMVAGEYISPVVGSRGDAGLLYIHGAFGDNYNLRLVGDDMKARWNIFGIRAKGLMLNEVPHTTLSVLVDDYLKSVKDYLGAYPEGIVGNCGGGMLALQIARKIFDETGQRVNLVIVDPPATFLKYHQKNVVNSRKKLSTRFKIWSYDLSRDILTKIRLGNSKEARRSRKFSVFFHLVELIRQVYPEPFPVNLLIFVGDNLMDESVPGFQAWANDDVLLRILPLPGRHSQLHDMNHDVIDKEIIEFVDEMNSKKHSAKTI